MVDPMFGGYKTEQAGAVESAALHLQLVQENEFGGCGLEVGVRAEGRVGVADVVEDEGQRSQKERGDSNCEHFSGQESADFGPEDRHRGAGEACQSPQHERLVPEPQPQKKESLRQMTHLIPSLGEFEQAETAGHK